MHRSDPRGCTVAPSTRIAKEAEQKSLLQMDGAITRCLDPSDFLKFKCGSKHHPEGPPLFGEVVATVNKDRLQCWIYSLMTSSILTRFLLPPITTSTFPVAVRSVIIEVVATNTFETITRDEAEVIVIIMPIREVESGNLFITGAANLYSVHYLVDKTTVTAFGMIEFFGYHFI